MNEPRMPALLTSRRRPEFYFRLLREGEVGAADEIVKVGEAEERMTVATAGCYRNGATVFADAISPSNS
jgi:MOSC domain-containing protein YiiM